MLDVSNFSAMSQTQYEDILLFHKFLYFEMQEPMIDDWQYDKIYDELTESFPDSFLLQEKGFPIEHYEKYYARYRRRKEFLKSHNIIGPKKELPPIGKFDSMFVRI